MKFDQCGGKKRKEKKRDESRLKGRNLITRQTFNG